MLIGFNGKMGVGKSEAIKTLNEVSNRPVELIKFAGVLYEIQELIYAKISPVYTRPPNFVKDRKLLQWLGTDWGRETISENIWVDLWKAKVVEALGRGSTVVCDDVRFDNEAELVKSLGGLVVQITSNRTDERIDTKAGIANHASEAGIKESFIDFALVNNGTLEQYKESLLRLYSMVGIGEKSEQFNNASA
jgi:hypothetical protein